MRIAAFDSGIGGLSAIAPLFHHYPGLEIVYLGDLANLPYGIKSPARIQELTRRNTEWLVNEERRAGRQVQHFVIACNTASAHALDSTRDALKAYQIPVTGVLEPACQLASAHPTRKIVVLATPSTVSSQAYVKKLRELGYTGEIIQKACPLFVPLVEDNLVSGPIAEGIIRRYLDSVHIGSGDSVVLGCTHYPFLLPTLSAIYPGVEWIEAGNALVESKVIPETLNPKSNGQGKLSLIFTDSAFNRAGIDFLLKQLRLEDLAVDIRTISAIL